MTFCEYLEGRNHEDTSYQRFHVVLKKTMVLERQLSDVNLVGGGVLNEIL